MVLELWLVGNVWQLLASPNLIAQQSPTDLLKKQHLLRKQHGCSN